MLQVIPQINYATRMLQGFVYPVFLRTMQPHQLHPMYICLWFWDTSSPRTHQSLRDLTAAEVIPQKFEGYPPKV